MSNTNNKSLNKTLLLKYSICRHLYVCVYIVREIIVSIKYKVARCFGIEHDGIVKKNVSHRVQNKCVLN